MDKVVFAESWERYFADLGLRAFDDFYDYPETITVNQNGKRNVVRLALGGEGGGEIFFMKRFHDPHLKDILAARHGLVRLGSQAAVEWRNARRLLKNSIGTYQPVCMGERTRWGLEKASFFLTRKLDAVCLLDLVVESWQGLDRNRQEKIIVAIANLARTLHGLGISLPDLQIWHLYLHADDSSDDTRLSVIDLHRMTQGNPSKKRRAKDLGRVLWSMLPEYFDKDHRQLLLDTYLANHDGAHRQTLRRNIERYEATLNRRHTARRYYRNAQSRSARP